MTKAELFEELKKYRAVIRRNSQYYFHQPIKPLIEFHLPATWEGGIFYGDGLAILDSDGCPTLVHWCDVTLRYPESLKLSLENALFFGYTIGEMFGLTQIKWQDSGF
jgi:hypothetical protein